MLYKIYKSENGKYKKASEITHRLIFCILAWTFLDFLTHCVDGSNSAPLFS